MKAVCRAGADAHSCGSKDTGGSTNVFVNGYPAHRVGDSDSHGGVQAEGSGTVFVNGQPIARSATTTADALFHAPRIPKRPEAAMYLRGVSHDWSHRHKNF